LSLFIQLQKVVFLFIRLFLHIILIFSVYLNGFNLSNILLMFFFNRCFGITIDDFIA